MYDLIVIGGGITGVFSAYAATFLNGLKRALIIEKNTDVALVNSHTMANAQTLHGGDTETNFSLEKALRMKYAETLMAAFLEKYGEGSFRRTAKMALGVGAVEVQMLRDRFEMIHMHYPTLRFLERNDIANIEPALAEGRMPSEPIAALYRVNGYAVDYYKTARRVMEKTIETGKFDFLFGEKIKTITRNDNHFEVHTASAAFLAKSVIVAAGPYSLLFAHQMGEAKKYTVLPVAGSFYRVKGFKLNTKVYTVQDIDFPFAAPHMDPDVNDPSDIRFGPTAKFIPLFERHHWATFFDFAKSGLLGKDGLRALFRIITKKYSEGRRKMPKFILVNQLYDVPVVGQYEFLKKGGKKIIPKIKYENIEFLKGAGGIRPQIVDLEKGTLEMGTGKIVGKGIVYDITPSPGASDSFRNGIINIRDHISRVIECQFDETRFLEEFPETESFFKEGGE